MDEAKNLATILSILDNLWVKLTSDLTPEQLELLKKELAELELKMKEAKSTEEINQIAKDFYPTFSKLESLEFLANPEKIQMRSGSLPDIEEEIKIKLINYCVVLQDRLKTLEDTVEE
ncbi:MAG: hypothetical protein JSV49_10385 [Thermoplasmata archaeon]|nr:MAG: hypothetical protein JSV49_10385 [Thermoplasmata archaeon]